nr:MAG TPA: hypothetical protein [Caudoviricetes sp.]
MYFKFSFHHSISFELYLNKALRHLIRSVRFFGYFLHKLFLGLVI